MVKKRVPDWLNSSLWSSTPPPDEDRFNRYSSKPTTTTTTDDDDDVVSTTTTSTAGASASDPPRLNPPVPVPPPSLPPLRREISDDSRFSEDVVNGGPSAEDISRQAQLLSELSKKVINMRELRRIASQGIPDGAGIRSTVWKLLLNYLPPDRSLWSTELAKKRSQYKHFKDDLLMNPSDITRRLEKSSSHDNDESSYESRCLLSRSQITHGEHPLSLGKTSIWNQFFQDTEIIEQIDRDVHRTHPDMHFFSGDTQFAKSNQEALRSILMVFAKLNPGIRYVQGMNELLAPLYYVLKNDPDEENVACAEADTFFCFVELLSGLRDNFCQQLDNSVVGIRSTITRLSQLLKEHDEELWRHLEITTKVNPQFYAFRWITLLLTQEFNFADSLHIWDTLLSDPEGPQETLLRVCCAMLILIRRRLLAGDFTSNLKLLQNYPPTNISHLLYVANKLRTQPSA
ncbi:uncharacterized protein LOC115722404 [Cannabis sativa]|uniref:Rab-GAP TBC domain-containing protein n=1 Tax=Cannabis sativa TaxID=3483 RepID=A0A7J6FVE2_CANSA|nr:uncharacterized protein LOC115722404 [Cannabis sativa]KAF4349612.1 hypothetical protein F8388_003796 [Cannabis sativa]KAF4374638.1 hypothetical protein G4B88_004890 [Cannabis sativa]